MPTITTDLKINQGGTWITPSDVQVATGPGNVLTHCDSVHVWQGQSWVQVWPSVTANVTVTYPEWIMAGRVGTQDIITFANLTAGTSITTTINNFTSGRRIQPLQPTAHSLTTTSLFTDNTDSLVICGSSTSGVGMFQSLTQTSATVENNGTSPINGPRFDFGAAINDVRVYRSTFNTTLRIIAVCEDGTAKSCSNIFQSNTGTWNGSLSVNPIPSKGYGALNAITQDGSGEGIVGKSLQACAVGDGGRILLNGFLAGTQLGGPYNYDGTLIEQYWDNENSPWHYIKTPVTTKFNDIAEFNSTFTIVGDSGQIGSLINKPVSGNMTQYVYQQDIGYNYWTGNGTAPFYYNFSENINAIEYFDITSNSFFLSMEAICVGDNGWIAILGKPRTNPAGLPWSNADPNRVWTENTIPGGKNLRHVAIRPIAGSSHSEILIGTDDGTLYRGNTQTLGTWNTFNFPGVTSWSALTWYGDVPY